MISSARLPSVAFSRPPSVGPVYAAISSVALPEIARERHDRQRREREDHHRRRVHQLGGDRRRHEEQQEKEKLHRSAVRAGAALRAGSPRRSA